LIVMAAQMMAARSRTRVLAFGELTRGEKQMTKTALIVRDSLYRAGLSMLFSTGRFEVCVSGADVNDVIRSAGAITPELILMDIAAHAPWPATNVPALRAWVPDARIVVTAGRDDGESLTAAAAAGVDGTIHRDVSASTFLDILAVVMSGEPVYLGLHGHPGRSRRHGSPSSRPAVKTGSPVDQLSSRERLVLRCLTEGLSNKELARRLAVSENTVKVHLRRICRVLDVQNRTQAALLGSRNLAALPELNAEAEATDAHVRHVQAVNGAGNAHRPH
jgi:two-component system nitrate/nitrite response regulator NarL